MIALLACAALTCLCAMTLGQAVLRLCGATRFDWLAGPVGLSTIMLLAVPALHVPGRTATVAVLIGLLTLVAFVWLVRSPGHRPPWLGVVAGLPVVLLGLIPFVANGRVGTLGWNFNNDMAAHLLLADSQKYESVVRAGGLNDSYPLGMHAWTAVTSTATGAPIDFAFAGITVALPILLGWTALAAVKRIRWWGPFAVVLLVGFPFLVAGYFGQGSFKELAQAIIIMGCAIFLARRPSLRWYAKWVPYALLVAGSLSVYSYTGIVIPGLFFGLWLAGRLVSYLASPRSARHWRAVKTELLALAVGMAVLFVVVVPQLPRLKAFYDGASGTNGTGIDTSSLGNLAGPLPFWEALGGWTSPDYRVVGTDPLAVGAVAGIVLALVVVGAIWSLRRRELLLPTATALLFALWYYANETQSPYLAAKALMLLAPMLMMIVVRPLVERDTAGGRWPMPSWWSVAAPVVAVLLIVMLTPSSVDALRNSNVGPTAHTRQLQSMKRLFRAQDRVLFIGNDDFIAWELDGIHAAAPVVGFQTMPTRAEKPWVFGKALDFDSLPTETLNQYDWIIISRDAAGSIPPPELKRVLRTRDFDVYHRTTTLPPQEVLAEGDAAAVRLDCATEQGKAIVEGGGVAAVRPAAITVPMPDPIAPGGTASVTLPLPAGVWDLVAPYGGPRPVQVRGAGLRTTLPANLDRPGTRWPIGRLTSDGTPVTLTFHPTKGALTWPAHLTYMTSISAVPFGREEIVPIAQACGKLVDWYRPAAS